MPDLPDFDQIARRLSQEAGYSGWGHVTSAIAEQLRQVWNARGAADVAKVQAEAADTVWAHVLPRVLRMLDR